MVSIASEIERRGASPSQVLLATLLASMREFKILSYVLVCGVMNDVGRRLAAIYGRHDSVAVSIRKLAGLLEVGEFDVIEGEDRFIFKLKANTCRICPKGVGGLMVPEKLCPLVGLFAGYAGVEYKPENHRREGEYCIIEFKNFKEDKV